MTTKNITYITRTFKEELTNKEISQINQIVALYNTMAISNDIQFDYEYEDQITIKLDANWTHELDKVSALIKTLSSIKSFTKI